jgi:hypothetical protein
MSVKDIRGDTIIVGDMVRQVIYDSGAPIPEEYRRDPKRVLQVATSHYLILVEGSRHMQRGTQFEIVDE